jgi:hypothetical protein
VEPQPRATPRALIILCAVLTSVTACGKGGGAVSDATGGAGDPQDAGLVACTPIEPPACPDPPSHFNDVAPILQDRCVPCHYTGNPDGSWPLENYRQVADWQDVVRFDLLNCSMPPADGGVVMTEDERLAFLTWLLCGYPE